MHLELLIVLAHYKCMLYLYFTHINSSFKCEVSENHYQTSKFDILLQLFRTI